MVKNYKEILHDNATLKTNRLTLRPFRKADAADLLEYASDAQTVKFLVWEGARTMEDALAAIYDYNLSRPGIYAIELKENRKCIGCIDIRVEPEHEKAGFGYVLNRRYWGHGYTTEALAAVLKLCFDGLQLNRVESTHYVGNEGSGRVMQKCGLRKEGMSPQAIKVKGVFHDVVQYGITRKMWQEDHVQGNPTSN